jgi:membrane protein YdbS with pleckstrin-like domain
LPGSAAEGTVHGMAFPRRLLREGEDLVVDLRPHPVAIAFQVFVGVLVIVALILVLVNIPDSWASWVRWLTFILAVGVIVVVCIPGIVGWLTSHFVVTTERVIHRSGWISKHQTDIPLDRIQNIAFKQSVFERMIGAGDITLESAGEESDTTFSDVRHPEQVQKTIYDLRERDEQRRVQPQQVARSASAPAAPAQAPPTTSTAPTAPASPPPASGTSTYGGPPTEVADELAKLAGLRDRGVISEAEFQTQKARLLGS